jgi:hypothetical protein
MMMGVVHSLMMSGDDDGCDDDGWV